MYLLFYTKIKRFHKRTSYKICRVVIFCKVLHWRPGNLLCLPERCEGGDDLVNDKDCYMQTGGVRWETGWPWCQHQPSSIMIRNSTGILVTCPGLPGERLWIKIYHKESPSNTSDCWHLTALRMLRGRKRRNWCVGGTLHHPRKVRAGCRWLYIQHQTPHLASISVVDKDTPPTTTSSSNTRRGHRHFHTKWPEDLRPEWNVTNMIKPFEIWERCPLRAGNIRELLSLSIRSGLWDLFVTGWNISSPLSSFTHCLLAVLCLRWFK